MADRVRHPETGRSRFLPKDLLRRAVWPTCERGHRALEPEMCISSFDRIWEAAGSRASPL